MALGLGTVTMTTVGFVRGPDTDGRCAWLRRGGFSPHRPLPGTKAPSAGHRYQSVQGSSLEEHYKPGLKSQSSYQPCNHPQSGAQTLERQAGANIAFFRDGGEIKSGFFQNGHGIKERHTSSISLSEGHRQCSVIGIRLLVCLISICMLVFIHWE